MNSQHNYPDLEEPDEFEPFQIFDNYEDDNEAIKTVDKTDIPIED